MRDAAKTELNARQFPLRAALLTTAAVGIITVMSAVPARAVELSTEVADPVVGAQTNLFLQNLLNGVTFGLLLALASVGLSLIYGTTGLSNFAHGEQVTFGAAAAFAAVSAGIPLIWAAVIAVIAGGATGWLQDTILWSQLRKRRVRPMQQMIVSIGLALVFVNLLQIWMGAQRVRLSVSIEERTQFGPVSIGPQTLISMAICVVALAGVGFFLQRTRMGRATRAVSDNPALASATGISVNRVIRLVWILSGSLAALGGVLLALYENTSDFSAGSRILLLMFAAVTLGGLGHPFGALVGSLVVGIVAEVSTVVLPTPDLKYAIVMGMLILTLLVRPQGLLGKKERVG